MPTICSFTPALIPRCIAFTDSQACIDDTVISEREAVSMPESLKDTFGTVDADGDRNVSLNEYKAATANLLQGVDFASLDTDSDGVIGAKEADEMPTLSGAFKHVDSDVDGLISQKEFTAAQRSFARDTWLRLANPLFN